MYDYVQAMVQVHIIFFFKLRICRAIFGLIRQIVLTHIFAMKYDACDVRDNSKIGLNHSNILRPNKRFGNSKSENSEQLVL